MSVTLKTEGIVLKSVDYREADRLYTIFTKDYGKLVLRAMGVKKINSKLAGHLEPLTRSSLFIAQARGYSKIGGAQILCSYSRLKKDYAKLQGVNYCLLVFNDLVLEQNKDAAIYVLLKDFLSFCDRNKINALILQSFILKLLHELGLKPDYSQAQGDLAKVLHFLSSDTWEKILKLRISPKLWPQLNLVFSNVLKNNVSIGLQQRNFLL
ncbi:MAG: DNA repair protein RecO [Patescibacteria group bacterium]|jgi:DNA repair protein RecO (recombination protein O)